ncbi:DUF1345 domain-containing protein [Actinomycetospora sp. NBRC 106378]|uniref:DUF1345 domain-containing protein n=1 Tax=Actinomycetospora sp. NBRC 106378 TaxID=3032208 RepID=UPI0024A49595|nr:DUF1345 domain-containing protein [Actinomycetospora sp. NBRC 106378]GLZ53737.1 hypothetical protein Acsp07_33540 [Actinomycetospora sp. NBRC 106378]
MSTTLPAWRRATTGERRWPVALAVLVVAGLQLTLPDEVVLGSRWLLPVLELAVLAVLLVANTFEAEPRWRRRVSLVLTALISVANAFAAVRLVYHLVEGRGGDDPGTLLATGAAIWATNVIGFALWYWQFDRGGPSARARGDRDVPDFWFPQMQSPDLDPEWEPQFVDYLYVSFTNATAFSPTDTMPLSRWAKLTMLVQSAVSLATVALVVARAVNVLR